MRSHTRKLMQLLRSISLALAAGSGTAEALPFFLASSYNEGVLQFSMSRKSHLRHRHFRYSSFNAAPINCLKASGYCVPVKNWNMIIEWQLTTRRVRYHELFMHCAQQIGDFSNSVKTDYGNVGQTHATYSEITFFASRNFSNKYFDQKIASQHYTEYFLRGNFFENIELYVQITIIV